jgi:hypothetical protein
MLSPSIAAADFDQATWDSVEKILLKKNTLPDEAPVKLLHEITGLYELSDVSLSAVRLEVDPDPSRRVQSIEVTSQVFNAVNCTNDDQVWSRDIETFSRKLVRVTMTDTVTTTNTTTIDAGGTFFGIIKGSINVQNKKEVVLSNKQEQEFVEESTVKYTETRKVKAGHRLYVRVIYRNTETVYPLVGTAVVDAKVKYRYKYGAHTSVSAAFKLSEPWFGLLPKYREIELKAIGTVSNSENIDVLYEERPINKSDPVCNVVDPPDLTSFLGSNEVSKVSD